MLLNAPAQAARSSLSAERPSTSGSSRVAAYAREAPNIDAEISTIVLNRTYSPLKSYVQARAVELTDEGKEKAREHYAVGVGVALLVLDEEARKAAEKAGKPLDEAALHAGQRAAARAVLSVLPAYDRLAKELED